ncbi:putative disease resistance protein RGA4 [Vitis riparia]|uniref:putative disease resistance protein RGA4 n=1 Tax=Vitis riparia TaxID=96939 RepID=UPI00155A2242|nr:putative disease resistance protein RGA4 [Vitis riparia]XP_034704942.1 putative disease resistance protein RGA4 [Vitis riparia]XP_034704943.1 putative disease resistance protein RGA4 [Vitis riparia]XP_034704944.1 putative disease resistance protein RGA4 [Vitis riparia]XP_034704945.1 putative disease resistance protein RGA4 [Vitis riparia]XP_034704946.1 putative disease resistance protein RGA4 [Vitis riparia]XP_034704947.1 putative disease resistance protein RGA4 [Vitis riparia]XP_03470494
MAEQIPFSIAEEILTKLGSLVAQEIGLARGVRKELKKLGDTLTTIKAVLLDAEERQEREHAVENWVRRFKDVIYDADDLLDDFATYELGRGGMARQVSRFFSSSNQVAFHLRMGHGIKDIRGRLDDIANDISKFNFIPRATTSMRVGNTGRETHSFVLMSEIKGRDEDKEKIIEILLQSNNEENLSVVAIVGIGGLGKTTLAQLVYNDEKVVNHFDLRLWVCVSDDFDVKILVRNIIKSATGSDVENLELDQLKNKLHEKLTQKRYLLVLDDVWNEDSEKWNQLRILLKVGARGSKVVATTRSSKVASIMGIDSPYVLEGLNEGQSWALFKSLAFGEDQQNAHPNLLRIGEEITKMCNGVPLVIRTLGRILHSKTEESQWLSIKTNENLMSLQDGNNISLVLKLSYDNLPSHLKQCFTYCALFPKDYRIERKLLVQLWMAQGYIQPSNGNDHLEDVGDQYFEELLSRSLFQDIEKDDNNNILSCKMHDLIHDLAQFVVKFEIIILTDDVKNMLERVHHVSFDDQWSPKMKVLKAKPIRTLFKLSKIYFQLGHNVVSTVNTLIPNCRCLRVLDLSKFSEKLPKSLGKLVHLRYLDLSCGGFEVLPSGITSLQNLQTLKLSECGSLKELPRNMRKMINLRHLEIDGCWELDYMPCRLGELTMLQTLPLFVIGKGDRKGIGRLNELKCLNNLRGGLEIRNLQRVKGGALESKEANLKEKRYLQSLNLHWGWGRGEDNPNGEDCELVMEGLQPHPNLKELRMYGYTGVKFPGWMSSILPSLQHLDLKFLNVEYMLENSSSSEPFLPSLKTLTLYGLRHFKEWYRREIAGEQALSCPSLSQLQIRECDQLTTFQLLSSPLLSLLKVQDCGRLTSFKLLSSPRLSKLDIENCSCLESLQLSSLPCLEELNLRGVREEILWRIILVSSSLKSLHVWSIYDLVSLPDDRLQHLTSLKSLEIGLCHELMSLFQGIQRLRGLRELSIKGIPNLVSLPKGLQHVTTLETLSITYCDDFTTLPDWISSLTSLSVLEIWGCRRFKLEDRSKIAHIPTIEIR